jgi:hypothetical protein
VKRARALWNVVPRHRRRRECDRHGPTDRFRRCWRWDDRGGAGSRRATARVGPGRPTQRWAEDCSWSMKALCPSLRSLRSTPVSSRAPRDQEILARSPQTRCGSTNRRWTDGEAPTHDRRPVVHCCHVFRTCFVDRSRDLRRHVRDAGPVVAASPPGPPRASGPTELVHQRRQPRPHWSANRRISEHGRHDIHRHRSRLVQGPFLQA